MKLSVNEAVPDYGKAEGELGLSYDDIDIILDHIERRITISSYKLRKKAIKVGLIEKNKHKHEMPVVCRLFS